MSETRIEIDVLADLSGVSAEDWDACACPETADNGRASDPFTTGPTTADKLDRV